MSIATQSQPGTTRRTKAARQINVAEYLSRQIDLSGKTQAEIAQECGFNKPNIISMIKKGDTKLPLSKVAVMARSLKVDPMNLFRMVMEEYESETWAVIQEGILTAPLVSDNEFEIIRTIRRSGVSNPAPKNEAQRKQLAALVSTFTEENE